MAWIEDKQVESSNSDGNCYGNGNGNRFAS